MSGKKNSAKFNTQEKIKIERDIRLREEEAEKNAEQEELFTAYAGARLESKLNVPKNIR